MPAKFYVQVVGESCVFFFLVRKGRNLLWRGSSKCEGGEDQLDSLPGACYEGEDALARLRLVARILKGGRHECAILGCARAAHEGPVALCK